MKTTLKYHLTYVRMAIIEMIQITGKSQGIRRKDKSQLHPPVGRNQSLPPGSLYEILIQPHPQGDRQQKLEVIQPYSMQNRNHKHRKLDKMRWQRNMSQRKKQDKTPEEPLSEVEVSNLPEKEFRVMLVKMIQDLEKRMEAQIKRMQEMFNKELEDVNKKQR